MEAKIASTSLPAEILLADLCEGVEFEPLLVVVEQTQAFCDRTSAERSA